MEKAYKNISYFFAVMFLVVLIGFYPTYILHFPNASTFSARTHIHATLMTLWFLLLIIQPLLVKYNQMRLHRILGRASYLIAPLLIVSMLTMIAAHQQQKADSISLYQNVFDISGFATFYLLSIINKRNTAKHMRYMIITVLVVFPPVLARIYMQFPAIAILPPLIVSLLIIIALLVYEKFHQKIYRPYVVACSFFIGFILSYFIVPTSAMWQQFTETIHTTLVK